MTNREKSGNGSLSEDPTEITSVAVLVKRAY